MKWQKYISKDGQSEIQFPGKPKEVEEKGGFGALVVARNGKATFLLVSAAFPLAIKLDDPAVKRSYTEKAWKY